MELLLKLCTGRNFFMALAAVAVIRLGVEFAHYPLTYYNRWQYPPAGQTPEAGRQILADVERREAGRVEARYRRVLAQLEQARAEGFETRGLDAKARAALTLNTPEFRRQAIKILTDVEMAVPRKRVKYIPDGPTQAPGEYVEPDILPSPAQRAQAAKAAKKGRRK